MKPNLTWYANSQRIRISMMSVISGHGLSYISEQCSLISNPREKFPGLIIYCAAYTETVKLSLLANERGCHQSQSLSHCQKILVLLALPRLIGRVLLLLQVELAHDRCLRGCQMLWAFFKRLA